MRYLIAGHGDYAQGVVNTLKFFKDDLNNVDLLPYNNDFEQQLQAYLDRRDPAELLCVVTDLVCLLYTSPLVTKPIFSIPMPQFRHRSQCSFMTLSTLPVRPIAVRP